MRRSVLAVIGTLAGTALMLGAKLGTPPYAAATAVATTDNGAGIAPAFAPPPSNAPMTNPGGGAADPAVPAPAAGGEVTMPPAAPPPGGGNNGTYTGVATVQQYGYNVSVKITVAGGRITAVNGTCDNPVGESQRYCMGAVQRLQQETLAAQSAKVAAVSGATYTSAAYQSALQAAIDKM